MQGIDGVFRPAQVVRTEVDHHAQRGDDDAKDAGPERTHQHCVTRGRDDQADENVHQSPSAHIELEQLPLRDHVELVRRVLVENDFRQQGINGHDGHLAGN